MVNEIFSQIPDTIPVDKKLPAMVYYLAKNRLDKQFEDVEDKDKFYAALMELNELYVYFYSEDVIKISVGEFLPINIQNRLYYTNPNKYTTNTLSAHTCFFHGYHHISGTLPLIGAGDKCQRLHCIIT